MCYYLYNGVEKGHCQGHRSGMKKNMFPDENSNLDR